MLNATIPAQFAFFCSFLLFSRDKSVHAHTKQHVRLDAVALLVFFNHTIIPSCDWLVIHVKIMVIIFIYYFLQPFAVVGCVAYDMLRFVGSAYMRIL